VLVLDALADVAIRSRQFTEVPKLDYWVANYPDDWRPWYRRGEFYLRAGQLAQARNDLLEATRRRPTHAEARRLLIQAQMGTGQFAAALEQVTEYQRVHPDDAEAPVWRARCQRQLNQLDAARDTLEPFLSGHPQDPQGLLAMALVEADLEQDDS